MTGHAHQTPAQIRAGLKHPVIDGDGHWVEYDPVFSDKMRKVCGDEADYSATRAVLTTGRCTGYGCAADEDAAGILGLSRYFGALAGNPALVKY